MIDNNLLSGKWKGAYTQKLKEDAVDDQILEADFEMELLNTEGGFSGVCYDLEIEKGKKEKFSVIGFTEGKIISF